MDYCFLNRIYADNNDKVVEYEVVFSSVKFDNIRTKRVDVSKLRELAASDSYVTDFSFDGNYLKCSEVDRVLHSSLPDHGTPSASKVDTFSLFDLLRMGVENNFFFVFDEIADIDDYRGDGLVRFSKVRFSQSSMSVYYRLAYNGTLRNVYLVESVNNNVEFVPFYFAVPADFNGSIKCQFVRSARFNNQDFKLYYADAMYLVEPLQIVSAALINKASCARVRFSSAVSVVQKLLDTHYGNSKSSPLKWIAKEKYGREVFTISFESSYRSITKKSADAIIMKAMELVSVSSSFEEYKKKLATLNLDVVHFYVYQWLGVILMNSANTAESIDNCYFALRKNDYQLFYCDCYLYKLRAYVCCTGNRILPIIKKTLYGSNEPGLTFIKEEVY